MDNPFKKRAVKHFFRMLVFPTQWRYLSRWLRSRRRMDFLLEAGAPWIVYAAADYLTKWMKRRPCVRVFEYGSGGSTGFWLKHGATCVSVEHDAKWHERVQQRFGGRDDLDYRLVEPVPRTSSEASDPTDPAAYGTGDLAWRGHSFETYVSQIDEFPDGFFDIVLVDGRARPSCIMHALPKLSEGGILVLDNAERGYYTERIEPSLSAFNCRTFIGPGPSMAWPWRTDIYSQSPSA